MADLKNGSKGSEVKKLQTLLNEKLKSGKKLKVDQVFGAKTEDAVRRFQKQAKLKVTGIADKKTWDAFQSQAAEPAVDPKEVKEFQKQIDKISGEMRKRVEMLTGLERDVESFKVDEKGVKSALQAVEGALSEMTSAYEDYKMKLSNMQVDVGDKQAALADLHRKAAKNGASEMDKLRAAFEKIETEWVNKNTPPLELSRTYQKEREKAKASMKKEIDALKAVLGVA